MSIGVTGAAALPGGADPFYWSTASNTTFTENVLEGVSFDQLTGYFTIQNGYQGYWSLSWNVSMDRAGGGASASAMTADIIKDPAGAVIPIASEPHDIDAANDKVNATVQVVAQLAAGDVIAFRLSGESDAEPLSASLIGWRMSNHNN